jgi:hypothetical protein
LGSKCERKRVAPVTLLSSLGDLNLAVGDEQLRALLDLMLL